ncbi:dihydropteroate synthase [Altericroceibacterium spongiae]|uniref:dihydropteroate synthase n=1 Tax=Altericroceibacterium spongiae TaxID=2320269 RepID=A0A420EMJ0_9SPHN|nr:dihydropteroate synthase [Altericroceibacterium spongiae]RKF21939.1 dihydropteroate synthase [Altericroceibacterium spongiae]
MQRVYIRPIGFTASPQSENGNAVRIAGGMVYAYRFAITLREDGELVRREVVSADGITAALGGLPDGMRAEAETQWSNLRKVHSPITCGERFIRLDQPQIMGILNVTPDSFSDGGQYLDAPEAMRDRAAAMLEAGAAIIDVGGESTRPGADTVWEGEEIERVVPAVQTCAAMGAAISVDTRRPAVMEAAIDAGADIINDVSALTHDPRSLAYAASSGRPVVLMHAPGSGANLHANATYHDVVSEVFEWLRERRDAALEAGIAAEKIILDPGLGFGKSLTENLALMNALALFHALGHPVLLGVSRKRMIGALSHEAPADKRLAGSLTLAQAGMDAGVQLLRVHDVTETVQARDVWRGLRDAAITDFSEVPE